MLRLTRGITLAAALTAVFPCAIQAAVLEAGTKLEARLSTAISSRTSHPGDPVQALVIAPVYNDNRLVIPQGATLFGTVQTIQRLGLGIKHETAAIDCRFTLLQLPDGTRSALQLRTAEVETAREHVAPDGEIRGINPYANASSGASILISALIADVNFAMPALGVKFLLLRSPDPEIYFPPGTELILQLISESRIPDLDAPPVIRELEPSDERAAEDVLGSLPEQQTSVGQNRPSDLLNVMLLGTREQIERAFHAAGWYGEQRHSALAAYRLYHCLVQRTGYSTAPMTRLKLDGRVPDTVYQKSLDTFAKRHHIRLWREHGLDVWVGATTQDVSFRFHRMHVTHASDGEIDNERAKVVNDLWMTGCVSEASVLRRDHLRVLPDAGTTISTDGAVAVLRLNDCQTPLPTWFAGNQAPRIRAYPISRIFVAIGADLAHSNPFTLGCTLARTIMSGSAIQQSGTVQGFSASGNGHPRTRFGESAYRVQWKRPSITDPEMAASPVLTARKVTSRPPGPSSR